MKPTRGMSLAFLAAVVVANLYLLYRFYVDGLPLVSVAAGVSLSVGLLCRELRGFVTRPWLQRSLTGVYWTLLCGAGTAVILAFRPLAH